MIGNCACESTAEVQEATQRQNCRYEKRACGDESAGGPGVRRRDINVDVIGILTGKALGCRFQAACEHDDALEFQRACCKKMASHGERGLRPSFGGTVVDVDDFAILVTLGWGNQDLDWHGVVLLDKLFV